MHRYIYPCINAFFCILLSRFRARIGSWNAFQWQGSLQILHPDAGRRLNHTGTRAGGIILRCAFRSLGAPLFFPKLQKLPTSDGAVAPLELVGQALYQGIIGRLRGAIFPFKGALLQSCQHQHATHGTTRQTHTTDACAKRGGHVQGLFAGEPVHVGKGCHHGLRAVETFHEVLHCFVYSFIQFHEVDIF